MEREPASGTAESVLGKYLIYTLSVPERAVRSTVALAGGAAREAASFLVPRAFQSSKTYESVVTNSLKFLTEQVGGAKSAAPEQSGNAEAGCEFMARKAVGNFVDLVGGMTLHMSPLWLLAAISDVAYGSKTYVQELARELKAQGLIDDDSAIAKMEDVLGAIQQTAGKTASMFDTPPLSVDQLKQSLDETRKAVTSANYTSVLPQAEVTRYWNEMRDIAQRDGVSLLEVSSAITLHSLGKVATISRGTLTGIKVAGGLLNRNVLSHYVDSLDTLRKKGFYATVGECYGPYVEAVWNNSATDRSTVTEDVVTGRLFGRVLRGIRDWFGGRA